MRMLDGAEPKYMRRPDPHGPARTGSMTRALRLAPDAAEV
jgi:hypothetical protein